MDQRIRSGAAGDDRTHGHFDGNVDEVHIFLIEVIDETGGGVRPRRDKDSDHPIIMPLGNKGGDLGVVLKDLHQRYRGEGRFFSPEKLTHSFFGHSAAGSLAQQTVLQTLIFESKHQDIHKNPAERVLRGVEFRKDKKCLLLGCSGFASAYF